MAIICAWHHPACCAREVDDGRVCMQSLARGHPCYWCGPRRSDWSSRWLRRVIFPERAVSATDAQANRRRPAFAATAVHISQEAASTECVRV
jgi:hypothetical protein